MRDPAELLPHRPPMLLIDRLVESEPGRTVCEVDIGPDASFFVPGRGVPAWIGIEYMAQAVAAMAGLDAEAAAKAVPIGYLLGTRRFSTDVDWFPDGVTLRVEAEEAVFDDNGLGAYNCRISGPGVSAGCRLTVYRRPLQDRTE